MSNTKRKEKKTSFLLLSVFLIGMGLVTGAAATTIHVVYADDKATGSTGGSGSGGTDGGGETPSTSPDTTPTTAPDTTPSDSTKCHPSGNSTSCGGHHSSGGHHSKHKKHGSSGGISLSTPSSGVLVPYVNPDYKISIQYPSHWKISETNLGSHQVVKFSAPEATQKETKVYYVVFTPAFLIISVEPLASNNTTLDQHISQFFTIGYHNNPSNYKIVNSSGTVLAGIPAKKITMYDYMNNHTYEVIRVIGIDNGTAYRIAYYAEPGTFTTYLPVIQQMIASFRINLVS